MVKILHMYLCRCYTFYGDATRMIWGGGGIGDGIRKGMRLV